MGPIIPGSHVYLNGAINGVSSDCDVIFVLVDTPVTVNGGHDDSASIVSSLQTHFTITNIFIKNNAPIKNIKHLPSNPYLSNALFIERKVINDAK